MKNSRIHDADIVRRYGKNESAISIAKSLGVSKRTVYNALGRGGVKPRRVLHKVTEAQEQVIVQRYQAGEAAESLGVEFGVDRMTVYNMLERNGIERHVKMVFLTDEQRHSAVEMCLTDRTKIDAVAAHFGASRSQVCRILRDHEITLQSGRPRTCELDDHAFDVLTPESLYWMGFLFADGCVHRNADGQASLVCGLGEKDLGHLEKLRAFCKSTHKIRHYTHKAGGLLDSHILKERAIVYWRVRSNRLCDALEARGIVKKRVRVPADALAQSADFWRGCVDGDGAIGCLANDNRPTFMLCGQLPLIETFQRFLKTNRLAALNATLTTSGVWCVNTMGSTALEIIRRLYSDAGMALERKNARAQAMLSGDMRHSSSYEKPARVSLSTE